jgi:NAD(P)-dependent dehydrogenase (short-subunit alcohol dehydrogenase family)
MEIRLDGKVALVTGASKGIGKSIAAGFVEAGAQVMLTSRKLEGLELAAEEMKGDTAVFAVNVGDIEAADACVQATLDRFGRLDILVNNAATNPYAGPTMEIDPARFDKTLQVNIRGPVFWCQSAWKHALKEHPGVIINIASVGGLKAAPLLGTYNLTKAALIHLTRQLASELQPTRVVGIAPSSTTSASRWPPPSRPGAWASLTTSGPWPCSSPVTRRRGSRARPTSSTAVKGCAPPTDRAGPCPARSGARCPPGRAVGARTTPAAPP